MCAAIKVYNNTLRNSGARAGGNCRHQGIGGLGPYGVQYARQMRISHRESEAWRQAGSRQENRRHEYIDNLARSHSKAMQNGWRERGLARRPIRNQFRTWSRIGRTARYDRRRRLVAAVGTPVLQLISATDRCVAKASGTARGLRKRWIQGLPAASAHMIERYATPWKGREHYQQMISGQSKFRVVRP